jgi:MFS family permease
MVRSPGAPLHTDAVMNSSSPPLPLSDRPDPAGRRATFVLLAGAVFVQANGIGVLFPLLARIQAVHHLATWGLGVMSGASFLATLATQVTFSRLLDGRRARRVLLGGLGLSVAGALWFSLAGSLWALTAARGLGGIAYAVVMPAALRAGSVGVDRARRGHRLGLLSSVQMGGIVTGPLVGVGLYSIGGLALPFQVVAAASALILIGVMAVPSAGRVPEADREHSRGETRIPRPRATSPAVVAVLLLAVAAQLPNGLYDALWSRLLTDRGAGTGLIGLSLALFGVPFMVLAPAGGRLAGRRAPLPWAAAGLAVSCVFMASYGLVASPVLIVILGVFEACAQAVVVPGGYAAVGAVFPDRWAATGQGWFSGSGTAAAGLASLAGAPLYGAFGPGMVFVTGAMVCVGCALAAVVTWRRSARVAARDQVPGEGGLIPPPRPRPIARSSWRLAFASPEPPPESGRGPSDPSRDSRLDVRRSGA